MNHPEIIKLQKFLQQKFGNRALDVRPRDKQGRLRRGLYRR